VDALTAASVAVTPPGFCSSASNAVEKRISTVARRRAQASSARSSSGCWKGFLSLRATRSFGLAPRTRKPSLQDRSRQRGMSYAALRRKRAEGLEVLFTKA
jgi:hypothetical protein